MKKILASFLLLFTIASVKAQITIEPTVFTAKDPVVIKFNPAGTPLAGRTDLFLWSWVPNQSSNVDNGSWGGSKADKAFSDDDGDGIYEYKINSFEEFHGLSAGLIKEVGMLVKAQDGNNGQTSDFVAPVEPIKADILPFRIFPSLFTVDDPVTIVYDRKIEEEASLNNIDDDKLYMYIFLNVEDIATGSKSTVEFTAWANVGTTDALKLDLDSDKVLLKTFIVSEFFDGIVDLSKTKIITFNAILRNEDGSVQNPFQINVDLAQKID